MKSSKVIFAAAVAAMVIVLTFTLVQAAEEGSRQDRQSQPNQQRQWNRQGQPRQQGQQYQPARPGQQRGRMDDRSAGMSGGWDDRNMAAIAAFSGRAMASHLMQASASLKADQIDKARLELRRCAVIADGVMRLMPFVAVADDISNVRGRIADADPSAVSDEMLPIYAQLTEMAAYAPAVANKAAKSLKEAERMASDGRKKESMQMLNSVSMELRRTSVYLPVRPVARQVYAALISMRGASPNLPAARKAVDSALQSMRTARRDMSPMQRRQDMQRPRYQGGQEQRQGQEQGQRQSQPRQR